MDFTTGGGGVERTYQMSYHLAEKGIDCTILATDYNFTDKFMNRFSKIKLVLIPCLVKRFLLPFPSLNIIYKVVKTSDIIILMAHWSILNAMVFIIARYLNKPYVLNPVGTISIFGRSKLLKFLYNIFFGKSIIKNASAYIAVNKEEAAELISYGVDPLKVTIIPNGVDENNFKEKQDLSFRIKYGLKEEPFILFLGRLDSIKGPDLLLKAFCNVMHKLHPYILVFAGPDSGMLSELKQIVAQYQAEDRVRFVGYLGKIDKSHALHAAELVVIPSRQEAMSIVVLEAGITGTPVLITKNCGFNEIDLIDGGKVVSATINGIEDGLLELLKCPQKLKVKGNNLKKYTSANYSWNSVILKYIDLYKHILNMKLNILNVG